MEETRLSDLSSVIKYVFNSSSEDEDGVSTKALQISVEFFRVKRSASTHIKRDQSDAESSVIRRRSSSSIVRHVMIIVNAENSSFSDFSFTIADYIAPISAEDFKTQCEESKVLSTVLEENGLNPRIPCSTTIYKR